MITDPLPERFAQYRDRHRGATIIVCGCGTSLSLLEHPERFLTFGVNDVGRRFTPDYLVVVNERRQFERERYLQVERTQAKAVFTQLAQLELPQTRVVRFRLGRRGGTERADADTLHHSNNSPYVAVHLARHLGAKRIGLIGVDFADDHFFGATGRHPLSGQLPQIDREYAALAEACRAEGVELVNLSPMSRLQSLPRTKLANWSLVDWSGERWPGARSPLRVFFVHYRFLSCGTVFETGLREAADQLGIGHEHAYWDDAQLPQKLERFAPDLLFVVHGRRFVQRWGRRLAKWRSAVWLLDEPYEVDDTSAWSGQFDTVFVNDRATLARHRNAHYLPVAYDPELHQPGNLERIHEVGFVGGYNATRERWLLQFLDAGLLSYVVGGPWTSPRLKLRCLSPNIPAAETADLYRRTKIVINVFRERHHFNRQRITAQSLNPRVYEALACGALVVSEYRPELASVFPELPAFETSDALVERVRELLADVVAREQIMIRCRQRIAEHTYAQRLAAVLDINLRRKHQMNGSAMPMKTKLVEKQTLAAETKLPEGWIDCGGIATIADGEILLAKRHDNGPATERGLASATACGEVELGFEMKLGPDAVFLAKIHQEDRLDQSTNSYHLFCGPVRAYLGMHHRILSDARIARNRWVSAALSWREGELRLLVEGIPVAVVSEHSLSTGYCFLGVKGGAVGLRNVRLGIPEPPCRSFAPRATDTPTGWSPIGNAPQAGVGGSIVLSAAAEDGTAGETGLASETALTQAELSFELKLDMDASFIAKIHHQDRSDPATNSYHLICSPEHDYLAKHHVIFRRIRMGRGSWQSIVLRRTEHSRIELMVNGVPVATILDNQLQSGFCFLGVGRGRAEVRNIRLRDLADSGAPAKFPASKLQAARRVSSAAGFEPSPFARMPLRNLIYHVWPVNGSMWRWNLEQLKQRIDVFNGRRLIGIVYDARSAPPEVVMDTMDGHGCEFFIRPNDARGEAITFPHLLREVASLDPDEVTLYGHAKGVKYEPDVPEPVRRWTEVQYRTTLDNWLEVKEHLQRYALTGPFRMLGRFRTHKNVGDWHYSGTYFWMRHTHVFARNCLDIPQFYGGVEAWPGVYFKQAETGCLFLDQLRQLPYHGAFWTSQANPALQRWQAERRGLSPPSDLVKSSPFDGYTWPHVEQKPEELDWWIRELLQSGARRLLTIGAMHGGVEWHVARVFRDNGRDIEITTIDLSPSAEAHRAFQEARDAFGQNPRLIAGDSSSPEVRAQLNDHYDAVFIDGDHSYRGARSDWLLAQSLSPRLVGFHDIVDSDWHVQCRCCASRLWAEIKVEHTTDERIGDTWGGIGIVRL